MTNANAAKEFLAGRRLTVAKFVAHSFRVVSKKDKTVMGVVNLIEVVHADGKAPTVQSWLPREVLTLDDAAKVSPCRFKEGQMLVIEYDLIERNVYDAKNGVLVRAKSVQPLEP